MAPIKTPHAAVIVWNYEDRLSSRGLNSSSKEEAINEIIISTISLISISTNKAKSDPVGSFNLTLAPTRNWVSVLTPGSWCAILMSNDPMSEQSFNKVQPTQLKMLGRIDAVRANVSIDGSGTRSTTYSVQGRDWGQIFENIIYVDPIVQDPSGLGETHANALYVQLVHAVYDNNDSPNRITIPDNLNLIMSVLGRPLRLPPTNRLAKATHEVTLPEEAISFLNVGILPHIRAATRVNQDGTNSSVKFTDLLSLVWGPLNGSNEDEYDTSSPQQTGLGWLNAGSFVGQNTIWSILQDNCNYAMNELFTDLHWKGDSPDFRLYSRIKPFSYTDDPISPDLIDTAMRSKFQNIPSHILNVDSIIGVNAGVNWADKFNFIEIKPDLNELSVLGVTLKDKSQAFQGGNSTSNVFNREGFRPIFFSIKQLPFDTTATDKELDTSLLQKWVNLAKEWYFDCHKFLNGTVTLYGSNEYIPVGDNIMFDAKVIGVTPNYNSQSKTASSNTIYVLAHVESVQNTFSVDADGVRTFQTTINFVRGILVNEQKQLIGTGTIDNLASLLNKDDSKNSTTVVSSKDE